MEWAKIKKNLPLVIIILLASILRLWRIHEVPISLFGDELDIGYQAYSILKTGRDYYGNFLPIHFHSIAEWRTPLYLYSTVPTVATFGISPLGVRLPAAIFGILSIWVFYLLIRELFKDKKLAFISSFVLAISPWHIQYSRAAFEVTELLLFLLLGLVFFLKALKDEKYLWLSTFFLGLTPWIYSTAKLFAPLLLIFLFVNWWKEILAISKKQLIFAAFILIIIGTPIAISTIVGGGIERFNYISVFSVPTTEPEVGTARLNDAKMRGELDQGVSPKLKDRIFHNKFTFWGSKVLFNYLEAFSTEFLFIKGDINLRHSIQGMGEFYMIEIIPLLIGIVFFFTSKLERRKKMFVFAWVLLGVVPSSLTRDGGNHATRLILILLPLVFLIAYGIEKLSSRLLLVYLLLLFANFIFYQHNFWIHNPWNSERWWHADFREAIQSIKEIDEVYDYDKVVISTAGEPPWIFFAAWYVYPPKIWQENFPLDNTVDLPGFGRVSHIDKFYFGTPAVGLYEFGKFIDTETLYLATANEVRVNLIQEPGRVPKDLLLLKSVAYPSGEPAFYLFSGK